MLESADKGKVTMINIFTKKEKVGSRWKDENLQDNWTP